jgi:hypothetical protein
VERATASSGVSESTGSDGRPAASKDWKNHSPCPPVITTSMAACG